MAQTKTQRIEAKLVELGCKELLSGSRKYRKFSLPVQPRGGQRESFYWLGRAGALRVGPTSTDSSSVTDIFCARTGIT